MSLEAAATTRSSQAQTSPAAPCAIRIGERQDFNARIDSISVFRVALPLTRPYHLSLARLDTFDAHLVRVEAGEREGAGEVVPLTGYSSETAESVWDTLCLLGKLLVGQKTRDALRILGRYQHQQPFAVTPLVTALESLITAIIVQSDTRVPLVGTIMTFPGTDPEQETLDLLSNGFATLKVKVGWNVREDVRFVTRVQEVVGLQGKVRIDANQAYSLRDALSFVAGIDPFNVELFEQPFPPAAWESMVALSRRSAIPLMLDESVGTEADVARVLELSCASFVKFKLAKAGGMRRLEHLIGQALDAGLKVILGNGVATDVGNFYELLTAARLIDTAGEMNGFLKLANQLCPGRLRVANGGAVVGAGEGLNVDWDAIRRMTIAEFRA